MNTTTLAWGSRLHSQEVDIAVWWHPDAWTARQHDEPREYRFHCLGHVGKHYGTDQNWWTLELAQANRQDPGIGDTQVGKYLERSFLFALQDALSGALGQEVKPFGAELVLWNTHDAPQDQPCPYRHAVEGGYWPVQRKLFHLPAAVRV